MEPIDVTLEELEFLHGQLDCDFSSLEDQAKAEMLMGRVFKLLGHEERGEAIMAAAQESLNILKKDPAA